MTQKADFVLLGCPDQKTTDRCRGGLVIRSRAILLRKDLLCVRPREPMSTTLDPMASHVQQEPTAPLSAKNVC